MSRSVYRRPLSENTNDITPSVRSRAIIGTVSAELSPSLRTAASCSGSVTTASSSSSGTSASSCASPVRSTS